MTESFGNLNIFSSFLSFCLSLAGTVVGVVIYTGKETRSVLNTSFAKNKVNTLFILLQKVNLLMPETMHHNVQFIYLILLT